MKRKVPILTLLKPRFALLKRKTESLENYRINFRWWTIGFDLVKFKSGSYFLQYGKRPIKYLCLMKGESRDEFRFLTYRTRKNWVPRREFNIKGLKIVLGVTAKPLSIASAVKPKGHKSWDFSAKRLTNSEKVPSHLLTTSSK